MAYPLLESPVGSFYYYDGNKISSDSQEAKQPQNRDR